MEHRAEHADTHAYSGGLWCLYAKRNRDDHQEIDDGILNKGQHAIAPGHIVMAQLDEQPFDPPIEVAIAHQGRKGRPAMIMQYLHLRLVHRLVAHFHQAVTKIDVLAGAEFFAETLRILISLPSHAKTC